MERLYTRQFANFNPLPRKEGDAELIGSLTIHLMISIHSLVKRETSEHIAYHLPSYQISIHSLVKRETVVSVVISGIAFISIHSLVKRETLNANLHDIAYTFQSTPS